MKKLLLLSLIWIALGGYAQTTTLGNIIQSDSAFRFLRMDTVYKINWTYEQKAILVVADTAQPIMPIYNFTSSGLVEPGHGGRIRWQFGYVVVDQKRGTTEYLSREKQKLPEGWVVLFYKPEDWK